MIKKERDKAQNDFDIVAQEFNIIETSFNQMTIDNLSLKNWMIHVIHNYN